MSQSPKIPSRRCVLSLRNGTSGFPILLFAVTIFIPGSPQSAAQSDHGSPKNTMELSNAVNAALKFSSRIQGKEAERVAIQRIVDLHAELKQHPRFKASKLLQRHVRRIEVRLLHVFERLTADDSKPKKPAHSKPLDELGIHRETPLVLGQRLAQQPGAGGPPRRIPNANRGNRAKAATPGVNNTDHSAALIDMIASTIAPGTWDRVGGPSSLMYYPQGMALVVRAPQAVHEDLRDLLLQLRAAGP